MKAPKVKAVVELPSELKGLQGRLRYAIETRIAEEPSLSQNKLAAAAGVDPGNLSGYLNGSRLKGIQAITVVQLAKALRVNVNWLLTGAEPSGLGTDMTPLPGSAVRERL